MFSPRVLQSRLWHHWILAGFWLAQTSILVVPIIKLLVVLVTYLVDSQARRLLSRYSYFGFSFIFISFALQVVEYLLYTRAKLLPIIYLSSQVFKSIEPTWGLYYYIRTFGRRKLHQLLWTEIIEELVSTLTFWGALGYALHVVIVSFRQRQRHVRMTSAEQLHHLYPLEPVNTAANLKAVIPTIWKLLRWLNADSQWIANQPKFLTNLLQRSVFVAKYSISALPIVFMFPVSKRLPGEPISPPTRQHEQILSEWKYQEPYNLDPYSDSESDHTLRNTLRPDEESAINTIDLRTIPGSHDGRISSYTRPLQQASSDRLLSPRFLCFINWAADGSTESGYSTRKVDSSLEGLSDVSYIFISYTRRQFYSQIFNDPSLSAAEIMHFKSAAERDKAILIRFAISAAKEAGVSAFWIDFECIRPEEDDADDSDIEEVYRICDIVRASHSMAIILGPALDDVKEHVQDTSKKEWLLDWGERLWTVPEALLCPSEHRIAVYSVGSAEPEMIAKRNLPARVWDDAGMLRQLIDHYEASLHLTQLELISIALECLQRRQTQKRNAGDVSYALMGLLRLRPRVNKADTDFEAFARLSLANDSNMLLERLICLSNRVQNSPWHNMADAWDVKLWQIQPQCHIASLESNNTVMIGNTSGAHIDWTSLYPVDFTRVGGQSHAKWTYMRGTANGTLVYLALCYFYQFMYLSIVGDIIIGGREALQDAVKIHLRIFGAMWLVCIFLALPIPAVLSEHFGSEMDTIQPRFFGVEGIPKLEQVEACIFGAGRGRLKWSADCLAEESDPQDNEDSRRVFTLIDTLSSTATIFRAEEPPSFLFAGGLEQGMLRALLCSRDFSSKAFVKETVVRLESAALRSMQPLDRFRFSISPITRRPARGFRSASLESDRISIPEIAEFRSLND